MNGIKLGSKLYMVFTFIITKDGQRGGRVAEKTEQDLVIGHVLDGGFCI